MERLRLEIVPEGRCGEAHFFPDGRDTDRIGYTAHHLIRDGQPWYPIMGEFHYSRYPADEWEMELRKMKACGVQIVATYVFWIHHEEQRDVWRTDGHLDLRRFLTLCRKVGLEVLLRIGPWAHGECRNGGFPDWLMQESSIRLRTDDPAYLALVQKLFSRIFREAEGFLHRDGGPILGVQLENEYGHCGGEHGAEGLCHMRTLKRLAQEAGFIVPLYTATGWGGANVVDGEMLPVMGGYIDAPWEHTVEPLSISPNFLLLPAPNDPRIGSDFQHQDGEFTFRPDAYPFLTAELGGGLQCTFHRRPLVSGDDTAAQALCKLGTGAKLLGYYMFHGGTHPMGALTSMQESTASGSWTDVPVLSYDFQAPLGEYGNLNDSYYALKALHMLIQDQNELLAAGEMDYPAAQVTDAENSSDLRWSVLYHEPTQEAFLFVNNYQRGRTMAPHHDVRFEIQWGKRQFTLPAMEIPSGFYGIFPIHLRVGARRLLTTNAQLLCRVNGIPVLYTDSDQTPVLNFDGEAPEVILLSRDEALHAWRAGNRLYLSEGCVLETYDGICVLSEKPSVQVRCLPDGWTRELKTEPYRIDACFEESCRTQAYAEYRVSINMERGARMDDAMLALDFTGDHAEVYQSGRMIADWYTTGQPWRMALKRFGYPRELTVRVYPVTRPTYFEIPQPEGMSLDAVSAAFRYLLALE